MTRNKNPRQGGEEPEVLTLFFILQGVTQLLHSYVACVETRAVFISYAVRRDERGGIQ